MSTVFFQTYVVNVYKLLFPCHFTLTVGLYTYTLTCPADFLGSVCAYDHLLELDCLFIPSDPCLLATVSHTVLSCPAKHLLRWSPSTC